MNSISEKKHVLQLPPMIWVIAVLLVYSLLFFYKVTRPDWLFAGDTLNGLARYSYQYSGFARGEYPIWNPLVRAGQPEEIAQVLHLANPVSNLVVAISVLSGVEDVILSYSIYVFVFVLLYAMGTYLLISCWTDNHYAGALASILAIGSSSVFWSSYHINFLLITHAVPWMLYAVTMYFRKFKFRYLIIFALAYNLALYSYQVVMGVSFIIMLSVAAMIFYHKQLPAGFRVLKKIPVWHMFALGAIMLIMTSPAILIFLEFRDKLLPISRLTDINVTDKYTITYQKFFSRMTGAVPRFYAPGFWLTLFTGIFKHSFEELRHYVGPLAFSLLPVALFSRLRFRDNVMLISFRRETWCIALSGLLILMLAMNLFPANLLYKLPVFSLIRNVHFFLQFFLFVIIILAGFGFDSLIKSGSKKTFNMTCGVLILISLIMLFSKLFPSAHNNAALLISTVSMLLVVFSARFLPPRFFAGSFLTITTAVVLTSALLVGQLPMSGGVTSNPDMLASRQRSDHSLLFRSERPVDIEKFELPRYFNTNFGSDEFSSYITLKDNSYKTMGGSFGQSSLPLLKSYYLFMSLPGHEEVMREKFFFLRKCYTSLESADMIAFVRDPELLGAMLVRGVGIVDKLNGAGISLGPFQPESVRTMSETDETDFIVKVVEYKANSIRMTVSVNQPGLFAYTDLWDEGWQVKLDGRAVPLRKVFHTFKGVELSPGTHELKFQYLSKSVISILGMNIVFILCILGLVGYSLRFARHDLPKKPLGES